eukprot:TRINITY_DN60550_c0_g1_i1.p1 TRINITY_DN60550_c0_g1~~TRINITY_DN60550_c0_g1_i1.p1  ORF type:complete len:398 (+),score=72.34 TRINITY_DN60550_c0_g1_i1:69-1262(+)
MSGWGQSPTAAHKDRTAGQGTGDVPVGCTVYHVQVTAVDRGLGGVWTQVTFRNGSRVLRVRPIPGGALWRCGTPASAVVRAFDGVLNPTPTAIAAKVHLGGPHRLVVDAAFDERRWPRDAYNGPVVFHVPVTDADAGLGMYCNDTPDGVAVTGVEPDGAAARAHIPGSSIIEAVGSEETQTVRQVASVTDALRRRGTGILQLRLVPRPAGPPRTLPQHPPSAPVQRTSSVVASPAQLPVAAFVEQNSSSSQPAALPPVTSSSSPQRPPSAPDPSAADSAAAAAAAAWRAAAPAPQPAPPLVGRFRAEMLGLATQPSPAHQWEPQRRPAPPDHEGSARSILVDLRSDSSQRLVGALSSACSRLHERTAEARAGQLGSAASLRQRMRLMGLPDAAMTTT